MAELAVSDEARKRGVDGSGRCSGRATGSCAALQASPIARLPRGATVLNSRPADRGRRSTGCSSTGWCRCWPARRRSTSRATDRRDRHQGDRRDVSDPRRRQRRDRRRDTARAPPVIWKRWCGASARAIDPVTHVRALSAAFGASGRRRWMKTTRSSDELKEEGYSEGTVGVGPDILCGRREGTMDHREAGGSSRRSTPLFTSRAR